MQNQPLVIAGGGLVFGVLLAVAIGESRSNAKVDAMLERAEEARAQAVAEATESMSAQIAALEASIAEWAAAAAEEVDDKLAALHAEVSARVDAVSAASAAGMDEMKVALGALQTAATAGFAHGKSGLGNDFQVSGALGVGKTAIFADGAVRAFVSSLDRDSGAAKLSVNGTMVSLGSGEMLDIEGADCAIGVTSIGTEGVVIGSDCGMKAPGAAGTVPPAPDMGYSPGTMAMLADGVLRVFVSGLASDGSSARIAVNGVDTQSVVSGTSVEVPVEGRSCSVTVTGVGNGLVGLDGTCG